MLNAVVIGHGNMGRHHARVYRELDGVKLVGVVDPSEHVAERLGRSFSEPVFSTIEAMLAQVRPDLASIAVPTAQHFETARTLIEQGIHVLIEKPITSTVEEGEQLLALAGEKGVIVAVGHVERFNPVVVELRRRLSEGMAGRVYQVQARRLSPYPARISDAGVVLDLASHDIDIMRYLLGESVVRLYGEVVRSLNSDREDMFNGLMRFESGAVGVLDVNWMTPRKVRQLTVTSARGMFTCDLLSQELFFYENESAPGQWDQLSLLRGVSEGNVFGIRISRHEPLVAELTDFVNAVRDRRAPSVTGRDGVETLRLALTFVTASAESAVAYPARERK